MTSNGTQIRFRAKSSDIGVPVISSTCSCKAHNRNPATTTEAKVSTAVSEQKMRKMSEGRAPPTLSMAMVFERLTNVEIEIST